VSFTCARCTDRPRSVNLRRAEFGIGRAGCYERRVISLGPARRRWLVGAAPFAAGAALLAWRTIHAVYTKLGHAGPTLDDAYIHFQYARAIAEGHPFRFHAGEAASTGATSLLWPALLAPFWLVGFRDTAVMWPAWILSFAALALLSREALLLTRPLAGRRAAAGAAAMVLAFGGFTWCAGSGMEVVPFAWAIARTARVASAWAEGARDRSRLVDLVLTSGAAALLRPEGALFAVAAAATIAAFPARPALRDRARALYPLSVLAAMPLLLWLVSGRARTDTAAVKLLFGNPYYAGGALEAAVAENVRLFFGTILEGEVWSAEFLPPHGMPVAVLGLASALFLGARRGVAWRAGLVVLLAAAMLAPCTYVTFLWNRLRYLWPFATGWIVGLACLARVVGDALGRVRADFRVATPLLAGAFAGVFAVRLDGVIDDVASSASGIDRQQTALGRWARAAVPPAARVGVSDTGAIGYFGEHPTFDIVGLTTADEGRYWVAGSGSRLEHYERLHATAPARLPDVFIVYPEWCACDMILGEPLQEATVTDATILGGQTMRAYRADYTRLGSGERPWSAAPSASVIDALDVADLEDEAAHAYELLGARDGEQVARSGDAPSGAVVDGGRTERARERFVARLRDGAAARGIVRVEAPLGSHLTVRASGRVVAEIDVDAGDWTEVSFTVPPETANASTPIEVDARPAVTVFHYFFIRPPG